MSTLWGEVSEVIEIDGLFPRVISRPVTVREALRGIENLKGPLPKKGTKLAECCINMIQGTTASQYYKKNWGFNLYRLAWDKISPTFTKGWGACGLIHPVLPRKCIKQEYQTIISYPRNFNFSGNNETAREQIANSVPPFLAWSIATQIRHKLWKGDPLTRYPKTMTYPEILEATWQDHLAPRDPDAPTVISTFAGGGGSSLGYSMAGYQELLAIEWDDNAVATFKLNFPDVPVYHGDIAKLSVKECMYLAGIEEGELDLLDGSPPCQSYSTAGKRDMNDPRGQLFHEYVRLLRGLKPKVFVMENVPGLVKGKMKLIFAEIMRELKASGYQVLCKKLNAMYFYVPQSRERLIFIGVRNDLATESPFPSATSRPITARKALEGVTTINILFDMQKDMWAKMRPGQSGSQVHPKGHWFNFMKLDPNKPAPMVAKEAGNAKHCYWAKPFGLSIDGYKRISSFPDPFNFIGSYGNKKNRIGNSVPPLFARALAINLTSGLNFTVSVGTS